MKEEMINYFKNLINQIEEIQDRKLLEKIYKGFKGFVLYGETKNINGHYRLMFYINDLKEQLEKIENENTYLRRALIDLKYLKKTK